jgi:hypothetical protein
MALTGATGLAKCAKIATPEPMRAGLLRTSLRFLTWCCVAVLAFLSLLPAPDMVRTGFPGQLEHFVAYAGSAAIATAGYGLNRSATRVIGASGCTRGYLNICSTSRPVDIYRPMVPPDWAGASGAIADRRVDPLARKRAPRQSGIPNPSCLARRRLRA